MNYGIFDDYIKFHYFPIEKDKKYLTDFIKEEDIDDWSYNTPVFISAQTGKGKNFFIQHSLIRKVHNDNKKWNRNYKILLLSNRVALNRQSKIQLADLLLDLGYEKPSQQIKLYTDTGIDKLFINLDIIVIYSYQQFYEKYKDDKSSIHNLKYIICDECHFFTSDSTFYPYSNEIINIITHKFNSSIRIYMSATLEEAFLPIMYSEKKRKNPIVFSSNRDDFRPIYYYFQRNYDYIKRINVYNNLTQLAEFIEKKQKDNPKDKWLIFVSSKKNGEKLLENLQNLSISSIFLTKESKNSNRNKDEFCVYQNIVTQECFEQSVLISTSVLDNGINIKDSAVRHIVIDMLDRTEFIQMLGRIRIFDDLKIELYIKNYSENDIYKLLYGDLTSLVIRLQLETIPKEKRISFFNSLVQKENYEQDFKDKDKLFYLVQKNKKTKLKYNICSIFKLVDRISTYFSILQTNYPNFHIDYSKLPTYLRPKRQDIIDFFKKPEVLPEIYNDSLSPLLPLKKQIIYILSNEYSKETKKMNLFIPILSQSFLSYIFIVKLLNSLTSKIKKLHLEQALSDKHDSPDSKFKILQKIKSLEEECCHYRNIIYINNANYPSIDQQLHWIEKSNLDDIVFLDEQKNTDKNTTFNEEDIFKMINDFAITQDEYESYSKETKKYIAFNNADILKNKGSKIKEPNENFQTFLNYFSKRDKKNYNYRDLEKVLEINPFILKDQKYSLKIVRGTSNESNQLLYCLLVKSPLKNEKVEEKL